MRGVDTERAPDAGFAGPSHNPHPVRVARKLNYHSVAPSRRKQGSSGSTNSINSVVLERLLFLIGASLIVASGLNYR